MSMETVNSETAAPVLRPSMADLCGVPIFQNLPKEGLEWLRDHMILLHAEAGEVVVRPGQPADRLLVIFEGELKGTREGLSLFVAGAGQVTGMLPYSRLTTFPATVRATTFCRGAILHKDHFPEMMTRIPVLLERLVGVLADRIRETTRAEQSRDKLMSLGKLSAGLAHELNNPASAASRAASYLKQAVKDFRAANLELGKFDIGHESRVFLSQLEYDWAASCAPQAMLDTLERSDREERLSEFLEGKGVKEPWEFSPALVDAGITEEGLKQITARVPKEFLTIGLKRLTASLAMTHLVDEIESSMKKITELVRAVKEYSYMDQMPEQEIDIHDGIENTLIMLRHRLKGGIDVVREYDRSIPKITARGSELNQAWTNLITNAIDAMGGKGRLSIHTRKDLETLVVDISDTGSGIPPEIQDRIFDPFFTTKGVNEGTGLGLEIVSRIVRTHGGEIKFTSKPGDTRFSVRLPLRWKNRPHANGDTHSPDDQATRNSG